MVISDGRKLTFHLDWLILCSHFKAKAQTEKADKTWRLLVKKVTRAKVMSSLAERKVVPEVVAESWARYSRRGAKLR